MVYCEVEDIQNEFKSIAFDEDDSAVETETVEGFIDQASALMDGIISGRYAVPIVAGPSALLLLKQICTWLVSQRVKDIVEVKQVRPETDQDVKIDTAARAMKMLYDIASGKIELVGATLVGTTDAVQSFVTSNNSPRVFHKNSEDW